MVNFKLKEIKQYYLLFMIIVNWYKNIQNYIILLAILYNQCRLKCYLKDSLAEFFKKTQPLYWHTLIGISIYLKIKEKSNGISHNEGLFIMSNFFIKSTCLSIRSTSARSTGNVGRILENIKPKTKETSWFTNVSVRTHLS